MRRAEGHNLEWPKSLANQGLSCFWIVRAWLWQLWMGIPMSDQLSRRLLFAACFVFALWPTTSLAAVTQQNIQTVQHGTISCWVGDSAANRIIDGAVNCVQGRGGNDYLSGMAGNDKIDGEFGEASQKDTMYGGGGTDTFYVDPGLKTRVDLIMDMAADEKICVRAAFGSWWRTVAGTSGNHRYIMVPDLFGGEVAVAWVANLGSKSITVQPCYLMNE